MTEVINLRSTLKKIFLEVRINLILTFFRNKNDILKEH